MKFLFSYTAQIDLKPNKSQAKEPEVNKQIEGAPSLSKNPEENKPEESEAKPENNLPVEEIKMEKKESIEECNIVAVKLKSGGTIYLDVIFSFFSPRIKINFYQTNLHQQDAHQFIKK